MIFVYSSVFKKLYEPVCLKLLEDGYGPIYNFAYSKRYFFQSSDDQIYNYDLSDIVSDSRSYKFSCDYLTKIETKYNICISLLLHGDRQLNRPWLKLSYDQKLALAELTFRYAESLIANKHFKLVWFESVGDFVSNVLYTVFKYYNSNIILVDLGRVPGFIYLASDKNLLWPEIENKYLESEYRNVKKNEFLAEKDYLLNFRHHKLVRFRYSKKFIPKLLSITSLFRQIRFLFRMNRDRNDLITLTNQEMIKHRMTLSINHFKTKNLFDTLPNGDFAIFFLHYQPEATTLVMAPYYIDQVSLIANISKSLPIGMRLIVKEHFASIGTRDKSYYESIKSNWNVCLLGPEHHAHDLISKSKLVFTINGTSGFEAILYGKPVIAFSRVCYDAFPFVYRFGDRPITELASTIQIALQKDFSELDILIFLSLIRSELIESDLILDHPEYNVSITSNHNINELFKLLKRKL